MLKALWLQQPAGLHATPPERITMKFHMTGLLASLSAVAFLATAPAAQAATASGPMTVTATVLGSCVVGASSLAFPSATSAAIAAGNVDAVGNVTVNCTAGSGYTVSLDAGSGTAATLASRRMGAGGNQWLSYGIYTTASRTTVWGDGTAGTSTIGGTGTGASQSIFAYGRVFGGQIATAANYADIVNVTVRY
jgi:spore coat protein U-like protein